MRQEGRAKGLGLLLVGLLVGTLLITPAGAHFTRSTRHLGVHAWTEFIRDRVYTRTQVNRRTYTRNQADARFERSGCPGVAPDDVMIKVGPTCIDAYEVSIWDAPVGGNQIVGADPIDYCDPDGSDCTGIFARSVAGVEPAVNITWFQAQQALANVGKRLPINAEWQAAVAGTPDGVPCRVSGGTLGATGTQAGCVSHHGIFDLVGNASEWVADWVAKPTGCTGWGAFSDDEMCLSGASETFTFPGALYRGGSFSEGAEAGPFALSNLRPTVGNDDLGFRGSR